MATIKDTLDKNGKIVFRTVVEDRKISLYVKTPGGFYIENYLDGAKHGSCLYYDPSVITITSYLYGNKTKSLLKFSDKSKIEKEFRDEKLAREIVYNEDGTKFAQREYDTEGIIESEEFFENGKMHGLCSYWRTDHAIEICPESGYPVVKPIAVLECTRVYQDGKLNGVGVDYEDGITETVTYFKDGVKHGMSHEYAPDGNIIETTIYVHGIIHGFIEYYPTGEKYKQIVIDYRVITRVMVWDKNGKKVKDTWLNVRFGDTLASKTCIICLEDTEARPCPRDGCVYGLCGDCKTSDKFLKCGCGERNLV